MNVSTKLIISALGVCALPLAQAAEFEDFGKVVRVQPRIEQVRTPRQECRTDYVQTQAPQRTGAGAAGCDALRPGACPRRRMEWCGAAGHRDCEAG